MVENLTRSSTTGNRAVTDDLEMLIFEKLFHEQAPEFLDIESRNTNINTLVHLQSFVNKTLSGANQSHDQGG